MLPGFNGFFDGVGLDGDREGYNDSVDVVALEEGAEGPSCAAGGVIVCVDIVAG